MILEILLLGLALVNGGRISRVVGGSPAAVGKFPYQGKISYTLRGGTGEDRYITRIFECNGAIINSRWILTAAHCLDVDGATDFTFLAGNSSGFDSDTYDVSFIARHPGFQGRPTDDIALLRLKRNITFNERIKRVELPWKELTDYNVGVDFAGWGYSFENGQSPGKLQKIKLNLISSEECGLTSLPDGRKWICVQHKVEEGPCMEDGGAPLVVNGYIEGISPIIYHCAWFNPTLFIRVFSYIDWILDEMAAHP